MKSARAIRIVLGVLVMAVVGIQLVPYGRDHSNPPVTQEPRWDSPRTKELAARACLDCHSNRTRWPWYSSIAPASWRIQNHVDEGRAKLNLSLMDRPQKEAGEAAEAVSKGEMPPRDYLLAHPEARLTAAERAELVRGLAATFGGDHAEGAGGGPGSGGQNDAGDKEHDDERDDDDAD